MMLEFFQLAIQYEVEIFITTYILLVSYYIIRNVNEKVKLHKEAEMLVRNLTSNQVDVSDIDLQDDIRVVVERLRKRVMLNTMLQYIILNTSNMENRDGMLHIINTHKTIILLKCSDEYTSMQDIICAINGTLTYYNECMIIYLRYKKRVLNKDYSVNINVEEVPYYRSYNPNQSHDFLGSMLCNMVLNYFELISKQTYDDMMLHITTKANRKVNGKDSVDDKDNQVESFINNDVLLNTMLTDYKCIKECDPYDDSYKSDRCVQNHDACMYNTDLRNYPVMFNYYENMLDYIFNNKANYNADDMSDFVDADCECHCMIRQACICENKLKTKESTNLCWICNTVGHYETYHHNSNDLSLRDEDDVYDFEGQISDFKKYCYYCGGDNCFTLYKNCKSCTYNTGCSNCQRCMIASFRAYRSTSTDHIRFLTAGHETTVTDKVMDEDDHKTVNDHKVANECNTDDCKVDDCKVVNECNADDCCAECGENDCDSDYTYYSFLMRNAKRNGPFKKLGKDLTNCTKCNDEGCSRCVVYDNVFMQIENAVCNECYGKGCPANNTVRCINGWNDGKVSGQLAKYMIEKRMRVMLVTNENVTNETTTNKTATDETTTRTTANETAIN